MVYRKSSKRKNWLVATAGVSFFLALLMLLSAGQEHLYRGSRNFSNYSLTLILFVTLAIAPIWEEVVFRGIFVKKKIFHIISLGGMALLILIAQKLFLLPLLLLLVFSYWNTVRKRGEGYENITIISSILLFSFVHYEISDFAEVSTISYSLFQLSGGAILTWIAINFSLKKSMIFHFSWNFVLMIILLFSIQFPDASKHSFQNDHIEVEWQKVPRFSNEKSTVKFDESIIVAKNIEARKLFALLDMGKAEVREVFQQNPYMTYNFVVKVNPRQDSGDLKGHMLDFLIEKDLVFLKI